MNKINSCQLIGTGTAGLCFIIALINKIKQASEPDRKPYQNLLDSLIAIEGSHQAGGVLDDYQINANTNADEIASCLHDGTPFETLRKHYLQQPETQQPLIPLPKVGELLLRPVVNIITELLGDRFRRNTQVKNIDVGENGIKSFDLNGDLIAHSKNMVLCCGGREELLPDLSPWQHKTVMTGPLLRQKTADTLPEQPGSIVIAGSSHSGFSSAWRFLNDPELSSYAKGRDIIILQRSTLIKLRCTPEFANRHQLPFDPTEDVCPFNGLVYRNAGLRKDAKALYLQIKYGEEKRVQLRPIAALSDAKQLLDEAALVIQCTGFKPNLPEISVNGVSQTIKQRSQFGELSDVNSGKIIPRLFGFGLGIHIIPECEYRGEKSFRGSSDGLLPYPNAVAPVIIDQLIRESRQG